MITPNSKKILLVDDSVLYRTKMNQVLTEAGHSVTLMEDGSDLIKSLEKNQSNGSDNIDMVILDLQMPEVDGFKALEWLAKNDLSGKFPVVCVTGAYDPKKVTNKVIKELGANALMTKEFTPEQTISCINEYLFEKNNHKDYRDTRVSAFSPTEFTVYGETYKGHLLNISSGGLFLQTSMALQKGTSIMLKFLLPNMGSTHLCIKSEVQWGTPEKRKESRFAGVGVKFTHFFREINKEIIGDYLKANHDKPYVL